MSIVVHNVVAAVVVFVLAAPKRAFTCQRASRRRCHAVKKRTHRHKRTLFAHLDARYSRSGNLVLSLSRPSLTLETNEIKKVRPIQVAVSLLLTINLRVSDCAMNTQPLARNTIHRRGQHYAALHCDLHLSVRVARSGGRLVHWRP